MDITALKSFLASQETGFESFLKGCTNLDYMEMQTEIYKHNEQMGRIFTDICLPARPITASKTTSAIITPVKQSTPSRVAVPTHNSAGKSLKLEGAGKLFRGGSGTKRRAAPESDSSPEASEVNTIPNDDDVVVRPPNKRRLMSGAQIRDKPTDDAADTSADNVQTKPAQPKAETNHQGTRRPGSNSKRARTCFTNPFISK